MSTIRPKLILILLAVAGMVGPLSSSSYYPGLVKIKKELQTTNSLMDLSVAGFLLAMAISPLIWGTWADNFGRRMPLLVSTFIFTLASVGCGVSTHIGVLIFCRVVQGVGSAAALSVSMGVLSDLFAREDRGWALGIFSTGPLLGPLIGPLLGGVINEYCGWRYIFFMNSSLSAGLFLGLFMLLKETLPEERQQLPPFKISMNPIQFQFQNSFPNPLVPLTFFKHYQITLPAIYSCLIVATFYAIAVSQSTVLTPKYHLNSAQGGLTYLPLALGDMIGAILGGRVADWTLRLASKRYDPHPAPAESRLPGMFPIIFVITGSLIGIALCFHFHAPLYATMLCQFGATSSMAFAFGLMTAYVLDLFPLHAASISAACNLLRSGAASIVTSINTILFMYLGPLGTFSLFASLQIVGLLIFLFLKFKKSTFPPISTTQEKDLNTDIFTISTSTSPPNPPTVPLFSSHSLFLSSVHNLATIANLTSTSLNISNPEASKSSPMILL